MIVINKLIITSKTGHFGKVLGYDDRYTYDVPPPGTVIGMLKVIYGDDIDNFIFGYLFESSAKFRDTITIHKRDGKAERVKKGSIYISDCQFIELLYNCKLTIYTNIDRDIKVDYILNMGKTDNIARLHLPIEKIELSNKKGQGYRQFTTPNIGTGRIQMCNMMSYYVPELNSYDHQVEKLRFNKVFDYDKNYDEEEKQSIFLWEAKNGEVKPYND